MTPTNPFTPFVPPSDPRFSESKEGADASDDAERRRTRAHSQLLYEAKCDPTLEALATHQLTEPVALAWLRKRFVLNSEPHSAKLSRSASDDWQNLDWLREEFASETQDGIGVEPSAVGIVFALNERRREREQQFEEAIYLQEQKDHYAWMRRREDWLREHDDWLREHGCPSLVDGKWCVIAEEEPPATPPTALDINASPPTNCETPR